MTRSAVKAGTQLSTGGPESICTSSPPADLKLRGGTQNGADACANCMRAAMSQGISDAHPAAPATQAVNQRRTPANSFQSMFFPAPNCWTA